MKYLALFAIVSLTSGAALAGATNVEVTCVDSKNQVVLKAFVPGDYSDAQVSVISGGKTQTYLNQIAITNMKLSGKDPSVEFPGYHEAIITTFDEVADYKVFSIRVSDSTGHNSTKATLLADPRTVRIRVRNYERKGTFNGKFWTISSPLGETAVKCTYNYSV
ncbi:MAG TPA: hypothetical protein VFV50_14830 [Bdellovibrionales bacterium]|nr:hypothetical protein [Bdellovibrionales bacterium]